MNYIAIQRKKDGAFVSGSDFNYCPPRCIIADDYRPPLLFPLDERVWTSELKRRKINMKQYKKVIVEIKEEARAEFYLKEVNLKRNAKIKAFIEEEEK